MSSTTRMTTQILLRLMQSWKDGDCPPEILCDALSEYGIDPDSILASHEEMAFAIHKVFRIKPPQALKEKIQNVSEKEDAFFTATVRDHMCNCYRSQETRDLCRAWNVIKKRLEEAEIDANCHHHPSTL